MNDRPPTTLAGSVAATEEEIRAEMASSLGRVGDKLERGLARLATVRAGIDALGDRFPEERRRLAAAYHQLRAEAAELRFYLVVQREAMGLVRHHEVDLHYPLPPPLPLD